MGGGRPPCQGGGGADICMGVNICDGGGGRSAGGGIDETVPLGKGFPGTGAPLAGAIFGIVGGPLANIVWGLLL